MSKTHALTTTTFDLPGYRVTRSFGVVRGIIVRSRSVVGQLGASLQQLVGGNITIYTELCEHAREEAAHDPEEGAAAPAGRSRGRTHRNSGANCPWARQHVQSLVHWSVRWLSTPWNLPGPQVTFG